MRHGWKSVVLLGLMVAVGRGQDTQEKAKSALAPALEVLKKEFNAEQKTYVDKLRSEMTERSTAMKKAMEEASTAEEKAALRKKYSSMPAVNMMNGPAKTFAPKFLALAEKDVNDPAAFDAVLMAMQYSGGATSKTGVWEQALKCMQANYMTKPEIKRALPLLTRSGDDNAISLVREVIAKHPDRAVQARACKTLAEARKMAVQQAEQLSSNPAIRQNAEAQIGKERIEAILAGAAKAKQESEELTKMLKDRFADAFADLSIGKAAPEIVSQDLDGKPVKLSSLKGKVVVLDIWATWCGPCRAMIPHEREMVERLKDKPFALVSISADAEKKTLTDFLVTEKMPWAHWWNGAQGGILEDWDVQYFPTIYVLDDKGVIRHKDLRGEKLEEAVVELIKDAGTKPK